MQITVNVLEHFSKEIHTNLKILNTSNMETEHAYIVFTYKGNFVQWCNILSIIYWEREKPPSSQKRTPDKNKFPIYTYMYVHLEYNRVFKTYLKYFGKRKQGVCCLQIVLFLCFQN